MVPLDTAKLLMLGDAEDERRAKLYVQRAALDPSKLWAVHISPVRNRATVLNRLYWSDLHQIEAHTGQPVGDLHLIFTSYFLGMRPVFGTGHPTRWRPFSTKVIQSDCFSTYLEQCRSAAIYEIGQSLIPDYTI